MIKASNHNIDPLKWIFGIQVGYGCMIKSFCVVGMGLKALTIVKGGK
jgi:hypothetical protein